jgi:superfamily II DNA or RNA helicase
MRELRPLQTAAIGKLRDALRNGCKRPVLQAPTGFGKTLLAAAIVNMALAKRNRVLFCVPAISLIDQTAREFYAEGIRDVGVIQADHPMTDPSKPVQICSVQTLARRAIPEAQLVIVDEAHRRSEFLERWMCMDDWASVPFIGLSATPWSRGLGRVYDRLIVATTTAELIEQGYLSKFKVFAPSHPDLSGVRTVAGDYREDDLSKAMRKGTLVADVVQTWMKLADERPTLCFAVDRVHAQTLQAQFAETGVECGYMDAHTPREERERIRLAFQAGRVKVVCNVGVLTTGVDWDVRCIILARPTKSEILFVQIVGRGLRTAPGKDHCLILDHSDTTLRLGFVTDIHHEHLNDGNLPEGSRTADEKAPPKPKECPACGCLRKPNISTCPQCGYVPERSTQVETVQGELIALGDVARKKAKKPDDVGWPVKIAFIRQLKAYALLKDKSDGWVAHRYRAKFGVWPNHPNVRYAAPAASVSPEMLSWLQAQNIRYAKSRAGRAA